MLNCRRTRWCQNVETFLFRSLTEFGDKIPLKLRRLFSFGLQSNLGTKPHPTWGEDLFWSSIKFGNKTPPKLGRKPFALVFNRIRGQNPLKLGRRLFCFQVRFWVNRASFLLQNNMRTFRGYKGKSINAQRVPMNGKLGKPCSTVSQ